MNILCMCICICYLLANEIQERWNWVTMISFYTEYWEILFLKYDYPCYINVHAYIFPLTGEHLYQKGIYIKILKTNILLPSWYFNSHKSFFRISGFGNITHTMIVLYARECFGFIIWIIQLWIASQILITQHPICGQWTLPSDLFELV